MRLCDKCFAVVKDAAMFCTECGASLGDGEAAAESDSAIYPEITRANLLRMKGEFDSAEKVALGILKQLPNNATTHILLGDIKSDKNEIREALQWYEMAQDLAPENPTLRSKIENAKQSIERLEQEHATSGLEVAHTEIGMWRFIAVAIVLVAVAAGAYVFGAKRKETAIAALEAKKLRDAISEPISINGEAPPQPLLPKESAPTPTYSGSDNGLSETESEMLNSVKQLVGELAPRLVDLDFDPRTGTSTATLIGDSKGTEEQDQIELATVGKSVLDSTASVSIANVKILSPSKRKVLQMGSVVRSALASATGSPGTLQWAQSLISDKYSEHSSASQ